MSSHSRLSSKGKQRSSSPAPKKFEHYKQRYPRGYRSYEYREGPNRSIRWRMHRNGRHWPRDSARENTYYRFHKRILPPLTARSSLEKYYPYKPYQVYSPEREDAYRYMPRYSEGVYYPEYQWDYHPHHLRGRSLSYNYRERRSGRRGKSPQRSTEGSSRFEGKQYEDELRFQKTRDEEYSRSLPRGSEDFEKRSYFQKRRTEDRDYRRHGYISKRPAGVEKHDNREPSRNPPCKPKQPPSPHQEKKSQRHAQKRPLDTSSTTKASSDTRHKHRKTSDGDQELSDGKTQKCSKEADGKNASQNDDGKSTCSGAGEGREAEGGEGGKPLKPPKECHTSSGPPKECHTSSGRSKKSVGFKISSIKQQSKGKERHGRKESKSSGNQVDDDEAFDMKKSLIIKVDQKKMVTISSVSTVKTETALSADLSAVGERSEDLEAVLEYPGANENTENKNEDKFAQEIITVIHHVKVNCFSSSPMTLHERFSRLRNQQAIHAIESKLTPDSGSDRIVNMSSDELPDKHIVVCEAEETLVKVIDPNDLRHDIERRRKERLQNEDEYIFHIDSATERNDQPFPFLTPVGRPQNPQWP